MSRLEKLYEPVSGLSLSVFRIMLGILLINDAWKNIAYNRETHYFNQPYLFHYEYFEWVHLYPEVWMLQVHFWALLIAAIFITLGLFYRVSIVAFLFLFSYQFLLDQSEYLNHYYLVIVYLVLMCVLPMNARLSLDVWRQKTGPRDVPRWAILALVVQTEIVLLYAGIVKLNPDWLSGEPLGLWLRETWRWHIFGDLIFEDWFILLGAWGTVFLHLVGAPLLLFARTRLFAFSIYAMFHLMNAYTFYIGIFPYMTIGATLLFFRADWPAFLFAKIIKFFKLPLHMAPVSLASPRYATNKFFISFIMIWLFFQIIIPMRPLLYPGNVAWTEEGHKFSWRMKLRDKKADVLKYTIKDPESGEEWEYDVFKNVDIRTAYQMAERINLTIQYAYYLEEEWRKKGYDDVIITAETGVSLNGRPTTPIVSSDLDLTTVKWDIWPADWILENNLDIPHWSEREMIVRK